MSKMIVTHEVDNIEHWLASPKREEVFAGVLSNIKTFVHPGSSNRVGLSMDVTDLDAFESILKSDAGADAMKHDGVRPETVVVYLEG